MSKPNLVLVAVSRGGYEVSWSRRLHHQGYITSVPNEPTTSYSMV